MKLIFIVLSSLLSLNAQVSKIKIKENSTTKSFKTQKTLTGKKIDLSNEKEAMVNEPFCGGYIPPLLDKDPEKIYNYAEKKAEFIGGEAVMLNYIKEHIQYPPMAKESDIQGKCLVEFIVEKDGSINQVRCKKDIGGGCGKEAVRLVCEMPNWLPAKIQNTPVRYKVLLPIEFKL